MYQEYNVIYIFAKRMWTWYGTCIYLCWIKLSELESESEHTFWIAGTYAKIQEIKPRPKRRSSSLNTQAEAPRPSFAIIYF